MKRLPIRLMTLLNHLSDGSLKAAPTNVGLKTIFLAQESGLIETGRADRRRPLCRLTSAGRACLREMWRGFGPV